MLNCPSELDLTLAVGTAAQHGPDPRLFDSWVQKGAANVTSSGFPGAWHHVDSCSCHFDPVGRALLGWGGTSGNRLVVAATDPTMSRSPGTSVDCCRSRMLAAGSNTQTVLPFTGLKDPKGAAVDGAGTVYVPDIGRDRVVRLAAGLTTQRVAARRHQPAGQCGGG